MCPFTARQVPKKALCPLTTQVLHLGKLCAPSPLKHQGRLSPLPNLVPRLALALALDIMS